MNRLLWITGIAAMGLLAGCSDDEGADDTGTPPIPSDTVRVLSMATGTWWTEISYDTIKQVSRSSTSTGVTTTSLIEEHRSTYRLGDMSTIGDTTTYQFTIRDSAFVNGQLDSVSTTTTWVLNVGGKIRMFPENVGMLGLADTLMLTAYELPMTVGDSWTAMNASVDSATYFDLGDWNAALAGQMAKVRISASGSGTGSVERMLRHTIGTTTLDCFEILTELAAPFSLSVDSAISTSIGINIPQGTPLTTGQIDYTTTEHFSTTYTIPFHTRTVVVSRDTTNVLGLFWESGHDTTWSTSMVTAYYDATSGDTLRN